MQSIRYWSLLLVLTGVLCHAGAGQAADYGPDITLQDAKRVAAAAASTAERLKLKVAIAIVDTAGQLVYFEKADDTQTASVDIAIAKARSANNFRRSTKVFEDAVLSGRTSILGLPGAVPVEGGLPIVRQDRIIGAVGISGATSAEDGTIAAAAVSVIQ
ncbi:MAG TPA: heme-binding protein [Methylophilaceae bacterium]